MKLGLLLYAPLFAPLLRSLLLLPSMRKSPAKRIAGLFYALASTVAGYALTTVEAGKAGLPNAYALIAAWVICAGAGLVIDFKSARSEKY